MRALSLITAAAIAATSFAPLPLVATPAHAYAGCPAHSPAVGTSERKLILNALRPKVQAMTGKPVEFVVQVMDVACGYARVLVQPQEKGGAGDHYESLDALLVKRNGKWTFGMIAASEEGSDPAADQFKARYPNLPESLMGL